MLVCVGDLLEEVLVRLPSDPVRGADTTVRSARVRGGSAANVAAIDAETGGHPLFVGQVGADSVGRTLAADLESRGVDLRVRHVGGTGLVVTMVRNRQRSRLIDRGTARRVSTIDPAVLDNATQLYMAASAFTDDPLASAIDRLLGDARERNVAVTIGGPGPADLESLGRHAFLQLCLTVAPDALVLNRDEHSALGMRARDPVPGARVTVITNSRRPTLVVRHDGEATSLEVSPLTEIKDRTGVGDGFLAGFLASRRVGADALAATDAGHRVAAKVLSCLGPTTVLANASDSS